MMHEAQQFVGGVRELDLAKCGSSSVVDGVRVVQGLRTGAAFFIFLRANLALSTSSPMSSNPSTPLLDPWFAHPTPTPSSPSPLGTHTPLVPLDDIPELSLEPLQSHDDKVAGLHLVADSIAQMKQRAARALVFHPACLGVLATTWAAVYRFSYLVNRDSGLALLLLCGLTMTYLTAIRYFTSGYVDLAEKMRWSWLQEGDLLFGARHAGVLVSVLVVRLEPRFSPPPASGSKRRNRSLSLRGGKGVIRAWTTKLEYRGRGIGKDLLDAAVRMIKERCGKDAEVGFAQEHANSVMLLPSIFNGSFRRDEIRAAKALEHALEDWETSKRRKR